ncbi:kinetoplast polyadenylation/uridylation factor 1 [Leptomonas seymouri]|uniref:Kinetoplast polyadenylation/uridylation factor 1 n=1 Tax=Leptomonas seymouri TaxID=5684 RepID=A0A0N0P521_LEPSE|nr:kinetoplast polyadenylation/uridylation factor 1 [Leptomonas seymouri]|eukprot:KPI85956.1 kinetoplast polyadenylation/uridylation factor 1 [Leptomonas seymouri]
MFRRTSLFLRAVGVLRLSGVAPARAGSFHPFSQKDEDELLQVVKTKPRHVLKHVRQQVWRSRKRDLHFRNTVTHLMIIVQEFLRKQLIDPAYASQIMEGVLEECVKYAQHDMAHLLFRAFLRFRKYGCVMTVNSIRFLFESYRDSNSTDLMLQLAQEMKDVQGLRPLCIAAFLFANHEADAEALREGLSLTELGKDDLLALISGYEKLQRVEKLQEIVDVVPQINPPESREDVCAALFRAFFKLDNDDAFTATLKIAVEHKLQLTPDVSATVLRHKMRHATSVEEIAAMEEELKGLGYVPDATCNSIVITAYARLLHFGDRGSEELMLSKVGTLLSSIESRLKQGDPDMDISAAHIRAVIRGYGAAGRPDAIKDAWQRMQFRPLTNDVRLYNELLKWFALMGNVKDILAFKREMESNGVNLDAVSYTWIFRSLGKYYPRHVEEYYKELQERRVRLDVHLYTTLIGIFGDLRQMETVDGLLADMRKREEAGTLQFTSIAFAVLIRVYGRDLDKAKALYAEAQKRNLSEHPHVQTSMLHALTVHKDSTPDNVDDFVKGISSWGTDVYNVLLHTYAKRMDRARFDATLEKMKSEAVEMNDVTFGTLVTAFARWGQMEKVNEVIELLKSHEGEVSPAFYSVLASSLNRMGNQAGVENAWEDLVASRLFPDTEVYNQFLSLYSRQNNVSKMQGVLDNMMKQVPPNPVTATTVLDMLGKSGRMLEMESLFDDMKSTPDTAPTSVTFHQVMNAYAKTGDVVKMEKIYEEFLTFGYTANNVTYNILMDGYGRAKGYEQLEELRAKRNAAGIPMDDIAYCIMIAAYGRARSEKEVQRLFSEATQEGNQPFLTRRVLWSAIDAFCRCGSAGGMQKCVDLLPTVGAAADAELSASDLCGLIPYYCRMGQMNTVEELVKRVREGKEKAEVTYNALNAIARGYARIGRFDKAVECLHEMRDRSWVPDASTALHLSGAFMKAGLHEQAQQIIEWRRHYTKVTGNLASGAESSES